MSHSELSQSSPDEKSTAEKSIPGPFSESSTQLTKAYYKGFDETGKCIVYLGEPPGYNGILDLAESIVCIYKDKDIGNNPKSAEIDFLRTDMVRELKANTQLKAMVAAQDPEMFKKHFPSYTGWRGKYATVVMCLRNELAKTFRRTGLIYETRILLAETLEEIVRWADESLDYQRARAADEDICIRLLAWHWKGTSVNGLEAIRVLVRLFVNNYENPSHIYNSNKHLLLLLENWPEYGAMIINNGYNTKFKRKPKTTPQSTIEWFNTRIFCGLRMYGQIRQKDESGVPERTYNMFTKAVSKEGLSDDFWPVHIVSEVEPIVAKKAKPQKSPGDMYMQKMSRLLKKHPELCPNCLEAHELSNCPDLVSDARNNLAAYTVANYETQTSRTRPKYLLKGARKLGK